MKFILNDVNTNLMIEMCAYRSKSINIYFHYTKENIFEMEKKWWEQINVTNMAVLY